MYIPVMVQIVDDVIPRGQVDIESPNLFGKITSCYNCGSLVFYQVVSKVEGTESATDTEIYCAVCGKNNGGIFNDPFNEMDLKGKREEAEEGIKEGVSLIKMLKALDNPIRYLIVKHMLNSPPASRTYIHKLIEDARGKTSKRTTAYHLDILMQGEVLEKKPKNEYLFYNITPESVRTLESLGLIETDS